MTKTPFESQLYDNLFVITVEFLLRGGRLVSQNILFLFHEQIVIEL